MATAAAFEAVMLRLLQRSHLIDPGAVAEAVADAAMSLGAAAARLYLVDLDQHHLTAIDTAESFTVDGTMPGLAFVTGRPLDAEGGTWFPMVDGADRLGVLAMERVDGEPSIEQGLGLASLAALLLVAKDAYTDRFRRVARRRPLSLAAELHWAVTPPLTLTTPTVAVAGIQRPPYAVAGDVFDYSLNGGCLEFAIVDAMGHGLESSVVAGLVLASLRHSRRHGVDLDDAYVAADAAVRQEFGENQFATAIVGSLDLATGRLRLTNAGHPLPVLVRGERVVGSLAVEPTLPIGFAGERPVVAAHQLQPRDRLICFTDGVTEVGNRRDVYGEQRLADALSRETLAGNGPAETVRRLAVDIPGRGEPSPEDDFSLLLVEYRGTGGAAEPPPDSLLPPGERTL